MNPVVDLVELASRVAPGARLGLCADYGGVPMAALSSSSVGTRKVPLLESGVSGQMSVPSSATRRCSETSVGA